jgi:hypothetical protein
MTSDTKRWLIVVLILLILSAILLIAHVSAYDRIEQGANVYINETVDISGVTGWSYQLAYYDGYLDDTEPSYTLDLPSLKLQKSYYIDPAIFNNRLGYWYQYYSDDAENHGNLKAFRVVSGTKNITQTLANGTVVINTTFANGTRNVSDDIPAVRPKHIADYIVARGDNLIIKNPTNVRVWIFGSNGGIYNKKSVGGYITYNTSEINSLSAGDYTILIQSPGANQEFNSIYDNKNKTLKTLVTSTDGWVTDKEDLSAYPPIMLIDKIKQSINRTDDKYKELSLVVEMPKIDIISRDDYEVNEMGVIIVKGYTNVAEGTSIDLTIDDKAFLNSKIKNVTSTTAKSTGDPGDMRFFVASIPFSYDELGIGVHFITAKTAIGGDMTVEFRVYTSMDATPPINKTTFYMDGNEFKPTPTPEIVRVVETKFVDRVITQVIIKQLTPNETLLYENTKKVQYDTIIEWGAGIIALIGVIYIISVLLRGIKNE